MGQSPANKKQEALIHRMLRKTNEHHQHIERVYQEVKKSLMAETTKQKEQEGQRCSEDNNVVRRKAGNHALQSHGLKESEQRLRQETVALDKCKRGKDQIKQGNDLIRQGNDRIKQVNDRIK